MKLLSCEHLTTGAYQANMQGKREWDEVWPYCLAAYNHSIHAALEVSPYYMVYGQHPLNPIDITLLQQISNSITPKKYSNTEKK
eukprot:Pgem_evm2s1193